MITRTFFLFCNLIFFQVFAFAGKGPVSKNLQASRSFGFIQNKGQMHDQHQQARPDVLFGGSDGRMNFHLKRDGVSYQLYNRVEDAAHARVPLLKAGGTQCDLTQKWHYEISRVDVRWLNTHAGLTTHGEKPIEGVTNYYNGMAAEGVLNVKTFESVFYSNIYRGINLKWHASSGTLKYDFIVTPGADYRQIVMEIQGANDIQLDHRGQLVIHTPQGKLIEQAPFVTQQGRILGAKWVLKGRQVSYEISGYDPAIELIIDPAIRSWGTYYGGSDHDYSNSCVTDATGNVYIGGNTDSGNGFPGGIIATTGAHQTQYNGNWDAFCAKFNSVGLRQWATYYGNFDAESFSAVTIDNNGDLYFAGASTSVGGTVIVSPGAHKPFNWGAGGWAPVDMLLAKFNTSGQRIWATFYGDDQGNEGASGCTTDAAGNVYVTGTTSYHTGTAVATPGSHQLVHGGGQSDAYLVKFNSAGVRQWGTSYGSASDEEATGCDTDPSGDVFITGYVWAPSSNTLLATAAAHQTVSAGAYDVFLAKFSSSGTRLWGTYFGGSMDDQPTECCTDVSGNVYVCGFTQNTTGTAIATPSGHQSFSSFPTAFLAKFNGVGTRLWGTFYGDSGSGQGCVTDAGGNLFLTGLTSSTGGIATPGSHQQAAAGSADVFLAKFSPAGVRQWGTYYGGSNWDAGSSCAVDLSGNVYCTGLSQSFSNIATPGAHQVAQGGLPYYDGFLAKFLDCTSIPAAPVNTTPGANLSVCLGKSTTITATASGSILWYTVPTGGVATYTGPVVPLTPTSPGIYNYYAENVNCAPSAFRTSVTITVYNLPNVSAANVIVCAGSPANLTATGASNYLWSTGDTGANVVVTPTISQSYTVTGLNSVTGCTKTAVAIVNLMALPLVTITAIPDTLCAGETLTLTAGGAFTFTWSGGETGAMLYPAPLTNTLYQVNATDGNGCNNSATISITVDACTGIKEITVQNDVVIFPNPSNAIFTVKSQDINARFLYTIFDSRGRVVGSGHINHQQTNIDLQKLSSGLYFIHLKGETSHLLKMIKE